MRLIDADELKETLHETIEDDPRAKWWYDLIGIDDAIDFSPTITFNPPKHGRWMPTDDPYFMECSECGSVWDGVYYKHCPNCGARMDGGGESDKD